MPRTPAEIRCSLLYLQCHWPGSSCSSLALSSFLQCPCKALTPGRPSKAPLLRTRSSLIEILFPCLSLKPIGPAILLHLSTFSHLTGMAAIPSWPLAPLQSTSSSQPAKEVISHLVLYWSIYFHWEIKLLHWDSPGNLHPLDYIQLCFWGCTNEGS